MMFKKFMLYIVNNFRYNNSDCKLLGERGKSNIKWV